MCDKIIFIYIRNQKKKLMNDLRRIDPNQDRVVQKIAFKRYINALTIFIISFNLCGRY